MKAKIKSARTFGVEIEFVSSNLTRREVAMKLRQAGINVQAEEYNHNVGDYWKVITDSSCGYEVVSPILQGEQGLKDTEAVLDAMSVMHGVTVNRECGIHVHVHLGGYTPHNAANLMKTYMKYEQEIDMTLPPSRRATLGSGNRYAAGMVQAYSNNWGCSDRNSLLQSYNKRYELAFKKYTQIQTQWKAGDLTDSDAMYKLYRVMGTRYTTLNLECFQRYGTVEFRQHGGSLNSEKVCTWIVFCTNLVDRCKKINFVQMVKQDNPMHRFANVFGEGQSRPVLKYMESRASSFVFAQVEGAYAHATAMRRV